MHNMNLIFCPVLFYRFDKALYKYLNKKNLKRARKNIGAKKQIAKNKSQNINRTKKII